MPRDRYSATGHRQKLNSTIDNGGETRALPFFLLQRAWSEGNLLLVSRTVKLEGLWSKSSRRQRPPPATTNSDIPRPAIGQGLRYELGNFWIVIATIERSRQIADYASSLVGGSSGRALATIAQITATACLAADIRDLTAAGLGSGAPPGPRRIDSMRATLYNGSRIPGSTHALVEGWPSG